MRPPCPSRQRGLISTFTAILILAVALLAAGALLHSIGTSVNLATAMAFRQAATQAAEYAYRDALTNLQSTLMGAGGLDQSDSGCYYASLQQTTTNGIPAPLTAQDSNGVGTTGCTPAYAATPPPDTIHYVVERMCSASGPVSSTPTAQQQCLTPTAAPPLIGGNTSSDIQTHFTAGTSAAYRLTVRVDGPQGGTAYVQTVLH